MVWTWHMIHIHVNPLGIHIHGPHETHLVTIVCSICCAFLCLTYAKWVITVSLAIETYGILSQYLVVWEQVLWIGVQITVTVHTFGWQCVGLVREKSSTIHTLYSGIHGKVSPFTLSCLPSHNFWQAIHTLVHIFSWLFSQTLPDPSHISLLCHCPICPLMHWVSAWLSSLLSCLNCLWFAQWIAYWQWNQWWPSC